jgi:hypothetical protein
MKKLLSILNIEFLIRNDALKNWRMILFLSALAMIMIASGHSADRKIFKIEALKSDFIESKKQLLILKKETNITRILSEKGVGPAKTPPIQIVLVNE